jgi:hypothetical protein
LLQLLKNVGRPSCFSHSESTRFVLELPFEPRGRDSFHEVLLTHDKYDKTWHKG